jgi:hypothetical protein
MGRRVVVGMLMGIGLMVTACGGGASPTGQGSAGPPATGTAGTASPGPAESDEVPSGGGWGSAVIVLGETRTEFAIPEFGCTAREDADTAHGDAVDGSGASFMVTFPLALEDWDSRQAHSIVVTVAGHRWLASGPQDQATFAGPRVDTLQIAAASDDPRSFHATGSFFIVDTSEVTYSEDRTDQVAGTFDITCAPTS